MKVLSDKELTHLEQFFKLKQHSLRKAMNNYLQKYYDQVICTEKYVIAIGTIPIALVAHMDTVFKKLPEDIYYDKKKNVMWSPNGLGADDRAGVYAIVNIVKDGYRPTIILTTDEECGGLGASALANEIKTAPIELKYVIELDRQGVNDRVFYYCENGDFQKYVESFGFKTEYGTYTDICEICPTWGVAGVNLSIGYKNEHSCSEILHIGNMFETIKKVKKMLDAAEASQSYEYVSSKWLEAYGWDPSFGIPYSTWKSWITPQYKCDCCSKPQYEHELFVVYNEYTDSNVSICADCLVEISNLDWCDSCKQPFIYKDENNVKKTICYKCERKANNENNSQRD